jgi:hypothetical protein
MTGAPRIAITVALAAAAGGCLIVPADQPPGPADARPGDPADAPAANAVVYGNGHWIAAVDLGGEPTNPGPTAILVSDDAVTWTETARFPGRDVKRGAGIYADGQFVLVGRGWSGYFLARSPDGVTWTFPQVTHSISRIAAGDGVLVGIAETGVCTSTDGEEWTWPVNWTTGFWSKPDVSRVGGRFYTHGEGPGLAESTNGVEWAPVDRPLVWVGGVGELDGEVVTTAQSLELGSVELRRTSDGSWVETPLETGVGLWGIDDFVDLGSRLVATSVSQVATSDDGGATWTPVHPLPYEHGSITTDGNGTIAVWGGAPLVVSRDGGTTWTDVWFDGR